MAPPGGGRGKGAGGGREDAVVVGGGPTSCEFTTEFSDFLRNDVARWLKLLRQRPGGYLKDKTRCGASESKPSKAHSDPTTSEQQSSAGYRNEKAVHLRGTVPTDDFNS